MQTGAPSTSTPQYAAEQQRPTQVVQVLYPHAESRSDAAATQTTTTSTTTTTTTTAATEPVQQQQARRGLDLDVTATHVDSYTAPTPIHLTIHPDPAEAADADDSSAAAAPAANAIAYLHSVHPALPVSGGGGSGGDAATLQQPQVSHARRNSEGAATSLNGQWTPLDTAASTQQQQQQQHAASVSRVQHSLDNAVASVPAAAATTAQQQTRQTEIAHSSSVPPVAAMLAPTEAGVQSAQGNTHVPWGTQAGHAVYAPATASHSLSTATAATAVSTGAAAGAVYRSELATAHSERVLPLEASAAHSSTHTALPLAAAAAGALVVGETREVGGVERVQHIDSVSGVHGERVAVAALPSQHHMPAAQTFASTSGPQVVHTNLTTVSGVSHSTAMPTAYTRPLESTSAAPAIQQVSDVSTLHGGLRTPVVVDAASGGPLVVGETRQVGGIEHVRQVDNGSGVRGERVAVAAVASQHHMPAAQTFASTTGPQVVHTNLTSVSGVSHSAATTAATAAQSEVAAASSPRPVHGDQVYASEAPVIPSHPISGSAARTNAHDQQYYDNRAVVQRDAALAATSSAASVVQVADASNIQGGLRTPVVVDVASGGPLVVGATREVGGGERLREVDDVSLLGRGERVAVAAVASQHHMPAAQTFASTSGPQVVHTNLTTVSGVSHSTAMPTAYTRSLDSTASGASSIQQVSDVSALHGGLRTPVVVDAASSRGPLVVGATHEVGSGVSSVSHVAQASELRGERLALSNAATTQSAHTTLHTTPLVSETRPAIQYVNQPAPALAATHATAATNTTAQSTTAPLVHTQAAQATQQQYAATQHHAATAATTAAERTVITREPVLAAEAAAHTTTAPLSSAALLTGVDFEHRHEHIAAGPTQVLHVDTAQLAGANKQPLGADAFSTKRDDDALSAGVKGMQLGSGVDSDKEQQSYTTENSRRNVNV